MMINDLLINVKWGVFEFQSFQDSAYKHRRISPTATQNKQSLLLSYC